MKGVHIFLVLIVIGIVLGVGIANKQTGKAISANNLPSFATAAPIVEEAYKFAFSNPEALNGVKCYCGCMQHLHDGRIHKRGLLDCFMKEDGSAEKHASQCDMCIKDALQVKQMTENGVDKETIKATIDSKYVNLGGMHG